ncbi:XRE family transcriptional regulator [Rhodanobacter glycinis]|nr:XRE family transcriptional regulator [Rhodanobacter glycinis]
MPCHHAQGCDGCSRGCVPRIPRHAERPGASRLVSAGGRSTLPAARRTRRSSPAAEGCLMRALELRHSAHGDSFALRLRASRERARMTQEALAGTVKITAKRMTSMEMGGSAPPSPELIGALARALNVPSLWLMAGDLAGKQHRPDWYTGGAA